MDRRIRFSSNRSLIVALSVGIFIAMLPLVGRAQEPKKEAPPAAPPPAASASPPQVAMPDAEKLVVLTRTTLLTLNDALRTGNFTVLRDVAAPGFRDANSAARLSGIFGNLAAQGIDLTAVAILTPQLSEAPALDQKSGMMRIKGQFPGQPMRIDFEAIYQAVGGQWRLFGLSVQSVASAPTATAVQPAADKPAEVAKNAGGAVKK